MAVTNVATTELKPGMVVFVTSTLTRTVESVTEAGWSNYLGQPLYNVNYAEGQTEVWGPGNMTSGAYPWPVQS